MAIVYLFLWQIVELAGYEGDFKYAVFIQALALVSIQPIAIYNAQVREYAYRHILLLFVPITLISTPLGQLVSDKVPTRTVQSVAGVLVFLVALWEMYDKRNFFMSLCNKNKEEGSESPIEVTKDDAEAGNGGSNEKSGEGNESPTEEAKDDAEAANIKKSDGDEGVTEEENDDAEAGKKDSKKSDTDEFEDNDVGAIPAQGDESVPKVMFSIPSNESEGGTNKRGTFLNMGLGANSMHGGLLASTTELNAEHDELKIGLNLPTFYTLLAGGSSGFLGGMVAIRGPPLILYFMHPPKGVIFNKNTQRATATLITFFNVFMRQAFYLYNTFSDSDAIGYQKEDWRMYLSVIICSFLGTMAGNKIFAIMKDSKDTIRAILAVFLLLCGASLLYSAFLKD